MASERWRESQFLEDKVHMMTHYLKQPPVTGVISQIALMYLKGKKKKSGLNTNFQKHKIVEGWRFPGTPASSTVQQKPQRDRAQSVLQNAHFPASCKISSLVFKYFTTTVLGATVVIEALFKVPFFCH